VRLVPRQVSVAPMANRVPRSSLRILAVACAQRSPAARNCDGFLRPADQQQARMLGEFALSGG
jgi:hypothetical protein